MDSIREAIARLRDSIGPGGVKREDFLTVCEAYESAEQRINSLEDSYSLLAVERNEQQDRADRLEDSRDSYRALYEGEFKRAAEAQQRVAELERRLSEARATKDMHKARFDDVDAENQRLRAALEGLVGALKIMANDLEKDPAYRAIGHVLRELTLAGQPQPHQRSFFCTDPRSVQEPPAASEPERCDCDPDAPLCGLYNPGSDAARGEGFLCVRCGRCEGCHTGEARP